MTRGGRILENPVTGERVKWLVTGEESGGELVRAEVWARPGGGHGERHVHPFSEERVELLAGRMELHVGRESRVLVKGDRAAIPAGAPHAWRNTGTQELHFICELDPALQFERVTEHLFALAAAGRTDRRGRLRLLDAADLRRRYGEQLHLASPPLPVQRVLLGALAPVAARRSASRPASGR